MTDLAEIDRDLFDRERRDHSKHRYRKLTFLLVWFWVTFRSRL